MNSPLNIIFGGVIVLFLLGCSSRAASSTNPGEKSSRVEAFDAAAAVDLEKYLVKTMEYLDTPGAAVVIVSDGTVVYQDGIGVREMGGTAEVTPQTLMMIGSITKPMTTLMMATMVDDGLFAWDQPVIEILPAFALGDAAATRRLTMENMVCNCSGVQGQREWEFFNAHQLSAEDIIESLVQARYSRTLERQFAYNSEMIAAAGYVSAAAAGGQYGQLYEAYLEQMQTRVLNPIGMAHSTFSAAEVVKSGDFAVPHILTLPDEYHPFDPQVEAWTIPIAPAAALWSNVEDIGNFMIALLNQGVSAGGDRVVSAENLQFTWEPKVQIGDADSYGLGWVNKRYHGMRVLHHSGGTAGYTSDLVLLPEAGVGVAVLSNQFMSPLPEAVRHWVLERLFDLDAEYDSQMRAAVRGTRQQMVGLKLAATSKIDPESVMPFIGEYQHERFGKVEMQLRTDGSLVLAAPGFSSRLWPLQTEPDTYLFLEGLYFGRTMKLIQEEDSRVIAVQGDEAIQQFVQVKSW